MKIVPACVCEKCGYYEIGEKNAKKVQEHERIPETGRCDSLDGLIVSIGRGSMYSVFRKETQLSHKHEILYIWENYHKKNLKEEEFEKFLKGSLNEYSNSFFSKGFTAGYILGKNNLRELSKAEFKRVSTKLKKMYPALYANTEFKRELYDRTIR